MVSHTYTLRLIWKSHADVGLIFYWVINGRRSIEKNNENKRLISTN